MFLDTDTQLGKELLQDGEQKQEAPAGQVKWGFDAFRHTAPARPNTFRAKNVTALANIVTAKSLMSGDKEKRVLNFFLLLLFFC